MAYCVIPARGGSKGIPRKNLKLLGGKPLLAYSIEVARYSDRFERVVVSTEDAEIAEVSRQYGAEVRCRPLALAADNVHSVWAVLDCVEWLGLQPDDVVCMLLPTSPFRTAQDVRAALDLFDKGLCDSVVSVVKCDHTASSFRVLQSGLLNPIVPVDNFETQRQRSGLYEVNGSVYVSSAGTLKDNQSFHRGQVEPYIMPKSRSLDINDEWDWKLAELLVEDK